MLTFKGDSALQGLGAKVKNASITFRKGDGKDIKYTATFNFVGAAVMSISCYNKEGAPTTLNFELLNVDGYWKLHYVHMAYHDTKSEFPDKATCPVIP